MIAGHLEVKKGHYYAVLNYKDKEGNRKRPWIPLGLCEKGNKKKAEAALYKIRSEFEIPEESSYSADMLFADYLDFWLDIVRMRIKPTTFASYQGMVINPIGPYFRKKKIRLRELDAWHIQSFYVEKLKEVKSNTVIRYHAIIYQALKYAVKTDLLLQNVAMKVERPKKNDFKATFLNANELQEVFRATQGTLLELPVLVASFYGLRRGEVLGLKWSALDFERGTLTINHTVTEVRIDGKYTVFELDSAKTHSSMRTLPLINQFRERFQEAKLRQETYKQLCGNCYNHRYDEYIFVNELGDRIKPGYLTTGFPRLLEQNGLPKMRFHDLRHCCASLLLANGVPLKQIQEWLGHSDFSTTANIYAHLDYSSKISSALALEKGLMIP